MSEPFYIARSELAEVFGPRAVRQFEEMQATVGKTEVIVSANVAATDRLQDASFVTLSANAELTGERVLSVSGGLDLVVNDSGVTVALKGVPISAAGHNIDLITQGDTQIAVPLTGIMATRENAETFKNKTLNAPLLSNITAAADDAAAATAGVPVGGVYRTGSALMVRVA